MFCSSMFTISLLLLVLLFFFYSRYYRTGRRLESIAEKDIFEFIYWVSDSLIFLKFITCIILGMPVITSLAASVCSMPGRKLDGFINRNWRDLENIGIDSWF